VFSVSANGRLEITYRVVGVYKTSSRLTLWMLGLSTEMDR